MKPWNLLFWKKLSVSLLPHFMWKSQTIKGTFLSFSLIREWMNMNEYEWICDWTLMLLKDFKEPLLSFELIYLTNFFCHRIENIWGFRYKILGHGGPLGKNLIFYLPWDHWNFRIFWAFCLYWSCPTQNLFATFWIMSLLQILKRLWRFIIQVTKLWNRFKFISPITKH